MNKKYIFLLLAISLPTLLFSQCWMDKRIETLSKYIETDSVSIKFNVVRELEKEPNYKVQTAYCWYNKTICTTYGGSSGKLLHGVYQEFFKDMQLKKKGSFYLGEKKGNWKFWYKNGRLKKIESYKKGILHGWVKEYDEGGVLVLKTSYKKGLKNGKQIHYLNGAEEKTTNYKDGVLIEESVEAEKTPSKEEKPEKELENKDEKNK